jgi:hypothetical protein
MEWIYELIALVIGVILGMIAHNWAVREDLKLAETVKHIVGAKIAVAKAIDAAKVEKAEETISAIPPIAPEDRRKIALPVDIDKRKK